MKDNTPKPVIFESIYKSEDPKATFKEAYPANIIIPRTAWINDPERGNVLIQYVKGERTIYAYTGGLDKDGKPFVEQTKGAKPSKDPIIMTTGRYTCDPRETTLIEYLRKSYCEGSHLIEGTPIYKETNVVKAAQKEIDKLLADNDLINQVRAMSAIELACLSFVMGDKDAYNKEVDVNKWNLMLAAKHTPEQLREKMENPKNQRKAKIVLAELENIIEIDRRGRIIKWWEGEKITSVPIAMDAIDYLVDLSFNPEYAEVYKAICDKLKSGAGANDETQNPVAGQKSKELEFVENCLASGVLIKKTGGWFSVKDAPKGDPFRGFHQGNNNSVADYLKTHFELKEHLEKMLLGEKIT